jgi:hypothetical protein
VFAFGVFVVFTELQNSEFTEYYAGNPPLIIVLVLYLRLYSRCTSKQSVCHNKLFSGDLGGRRRLSIYRIRRSSPAFLQHVLLDNYHHNVALSKVHLLQSRRIPSDTVKATSSDPSPVFIITAAETFRPCGVLWQPSTGPAFKQKPVTKSVNHYSAIPGALQIC